MYHKSTRTYINASYIIAFDVIFAKHTVLHIYRAVTPQILPIAFGDDVVNAGDVVAIQCMVLKGDLPIEITWRHNGEPIVNSPAINVLSMSTRISTLNIESVHANHRGIFECVAMNVAGRAESAAELMVNGTDRFIGHHIH